MKKNSEEGSFVKHQSRLRAGDPAPYFEGKDQQGQTIGLASFPGKTIILYFYPKDDTEACTATACSLRDEYKLLGDNDYAVVGVSADDEKSHAKFAAKYDLPFPLIADTDLAIIKAYDVWGQKMLFGRIYDGILRTTFIINPRAIIEEVITNVNTSNHAQQIMEL
ncbi:MAG: thioredoxin-dependent thiol peroxidase [Bacteroidota bacterium]